MTFNTIQSRKCVVKRPNCCLLIQTACVTRFTQKMHTKTSKNKDLFHCGDYAKDSPCYNEKVPGKFKNECAGKPMGGFVGLRSKMYSYLMDDGKNNKTCKGVKKDVIKSNITHENYRDVLFNNKHMMHKMKTTRSDHHQIGSYQLNKILLSCFYDKRSLLEDGISSYAYGHKNI